MYLCSPNEQGLKGFGNFNVVTKRARGGIGRRAGLRSLCLRAWEFDSPRAHTITQQMPASKEAGICCFIHQSDCQRASC